MEPLLHSVQQLCGRVAARGACARDPLVGLSTGTPTQRSNKDTVVNDASYPHNSAPVRISRQLPHAGYLR